MSKKQQSDEVQEEKQEPDEAATEETHAIEPPADPTEEAPPLPPPPPRRRAGNWLALLLALVSITGVGYLLLEMQELRERTTLQADETDTRMARLSEQIDTVENRLQRDTRNLEQRLDTLDGLDDELHARLDDQDATISRIREIAARDQLGWRLAEVRYLLNAATIRLKLSQDTRSAASALESADRILADIGDPRLLPLRESLLADIGAVRAVERIDLEGILLRLHNLERNAAMLALATDQQVEALPQLDPELPWSERILDWLRQLVVVQRRTDADRVTSRTEVGELPVREALVLQIEHTRRAALAGDSGWYQDSLDSLYQLIESHYDTEATLTMAFLEDIETLQDRMVRASIPDLDDTLDLAAELLPRVAAQAAASREED